GLLNLQAEELQGRDMLEILNLQNDVTTEDIVEGTEISHLLVIENKDEEDTMIRVNFSTIVKDTGFINGYIAVLHDVTEQERIDAELREYVAKIGRAKCRDRVY